ncbi:MAG: DUF2807 domain-containing protein [Phaeodactylibacter sp.]|nr:DUF2807 domain-containing protein [Phaeodactylibacter sp.]MCB9275304.1 DUF2807 domain-containing protein [Lewinellaceae bacterium]
MKRLLFPIFALHLLLWSGCIIIDDDESPFGNCLDGRGSIITTVYELSPYDEIELLGDVDVIISQGPAPSAELHTYENLADEVGLNINGGKLSIETRKCINAQDRPQLFLANPAFNKISNSSAADISSDTPLEAGAFTAGNFGSGNIALNLLANEAELLITGSGDFLLNGQADKLKLSVTGSGDFLGFGFETQQADILLTGSGDAEVQVHNLLEATITGSGSVFYKGHPMLNTTITGSGRAVDSN